MGTSKFKNRRREYFYLSIHLFGGRWVKNFDIQVVMFDLERKYELLWGYENGDVA